MTESVYKIVELVGTSTKSWEEAARTAIEQAGGSLKDLRIAEVKTLDMKLEGNAIAVYRTRLRVSFKYAR